MPPHLPYVALVTRRTPGRRDVFNEEGASAAEALQRALARWRRQVPSGTTIHVSFLGRSQFHAS